MPSASGNVSRTRSVNSHIGIDWICIFLIVTGCGTERSDRVLYKNNKKAIPTAIKVDELTGRVSARLARFSRLMNK